MDQLCRVWNIMLLILGVFVNPPLSIAQQELHYNMQVNASPAGKTFDVKGSLSFQTGPGVTDVVTITLSPCVARPSIRLKKTSPSITGIDTTINATGDKVYRFQFGKKMAAGTRLEFVYQYERGAAPAFQYYMDSSFCMAGGYGAAWYPQVYCGDGNDAAKRARGTAVISVVLPQPLMAVMAAATLKTTVRAQYTTYEFQYTTPDIFSLYIGAYHKQELKGPLPFYYFGLDKHVDGVPTAARASDVLQYLVSLFGPLSLSNFSIIEFPDAVSERTGIGGASIMGGIVMPANALKQFNYALFGHECAHQWWGNKVLVRGEKGTQLLTEGLAQYGSLQVVQHFDSAHALQYRKTGYPGYIADQCGLGYLKYAAAGIDAPLALLDDAHGHTIGASKGFLVLELLSNTIGKDTFHKALRGISDRYGASGLSWEQFLQALQTAHGSSLQWFYNQWFDRMGAPAWQTTWQQQQQELLLSITQTDSLYRLPLDVLITYANGAGVLQQVAVQERETQVRLPVSGQVTAVTVDPFFKVIHWDEALRPLALELSKVQRVQQLRIEQKPEAAETLARSYLEAGFTQDLYGTEFSLLYNLGRIKGIQGKEEEALAYYQQALRCASRNPDLLAYTYYRMAQIAQHKNDQTLFAWACDQAVKADALNDGKDDMKTKIGQLKL